MKYARQVLIDFPIHVDQEGYGRCGKFSSRNWQHGVTSLEVRVLARSNTCWPAWEFYLILWWKLMYVASVWTSPYLIWSRLEEKRENKKLMEVENRMLQGRFDLKRGCIVSKKGSRIKSCTFPSCYCYFSFEENRRGFCNSLLQYLVLKERAKVRREVFRKQKRIKRKSKRA